MIKYDIKTPDSDNVYVADLIRTLLVNTAPVVLDIEPGIEDEPCGCFENVRRRIMKNGGETVHGWQFWEHPYMIEAEFHAVWQSPEGLLHDITPKDDQRIRKILFVEDRSRTYNGAQTDNVRINTTKNELIDDLILVEKAKYRFMNTSGREQIIGQVLLKNDDAALWHSLTQLSSILEQMHLIGGTLTSPCFCNSGKQYCNCHRDVVLKGMLEILV